MNQALTAKCELDFPPPVEMQRPAHGCKAVKMMEGNHLAD